MKKAMLRELLEKSNKVEEKPKEVKVKASRKKKIEEPEEEEE